MNSRLGAFVGSLKGCAETATHGRIYRNTIPYRAFGIYDQLVDRDRPSRLQNFNAMFVSDRIALHGFQHR